MPQRILADDWSDYDNKKKKGVDARFFSCEEQWERDYLINKIMKIYPSKNRAQIVSAINSCCVSADMPSNKPRTQFVACVMSKI
jgi:hypothetical protein